MSDLPSYIWVLTLIGVIGIPGLTVVMLYRGALAAGIGRGTATTVAAVTGVLWGGWIVASALLAVAGAFRQVSTSVRPWIAVALLASILVALLGTRIPVVRRILAQTATPARLAVPQTFRVIGFSFLIAMALGQLPAVFALPAGLGDIAVGLAAPFVARRWNRERNARGAVWFNALGILDLVVAVSIGFLAGLGPSRLLDVTPSTAAVGLLPLVLIPTTAVPLALALHVVSLARIRATAQNSVLTGSAVPAVG